SDFDVTDAIKIVTEKLIDAPADIFGSLEKIAAIASINAADHGSAVDHLRRAERVFSGLSNLQAVAALRESAGSINSEFANVRIDPTGANSMLHSVVLILSQAKHPELLARELAWVLWSTNA